MTENCACLSHLDTTTACPVISCLEILEQLNLPVFQKNKEGVFTYVNQAFLDMLKLERAQVVGKNDHQLFDAKLAEGFVAGDAELKRRYQNAIKGPLVAREFLEIGTSLMPIRTTKNFVIDRDGNYAGTQGVFWDNSNINEFEHALGEATRKLAAREKERTMHQIEAFLTHQFKSPINRSIVQLDMTIKKLRDGSLIDQVSHVEALLLKLRILMAENEMRISQFLDKIVSGRPYLQPISLHRALAMVQNAFYRARQDPSDQGPVARLGESLKFEDERALSIPPVRGDEMLVQEAIAHIWQNALRHAKQRVAYGSQVFDDGAVLLWINDDGDGFDASAMEVLSTPENLSDPSVGFSNPKEGGIGIKTCFEVLRQQGMRLEFLSNAGPLNGAWVGIHAQPCSQTSATLLAELAPKSYKLALAKHRAKNLRAYKSLHIESLCNGSTDRHMSVQTDPDWMLHVLVSLIDLLWDEATPPLVNWKLSSTHGLSGCLLTIEGRREITEDIAKATEKLSHLAWQYCCLVTHPDVRSSETSCRIELFLKCDNLP